MEQTLKTKLELIPAAPGVYRMMDARGDIIYVGKALNLKNRVRQYFQSAARLDVKTAALVGHIADFDYILTNSEVEALTLESNLVKQYKPRYNILLKDDKHFPYVRIDLRKDFPRVEMVRRVKNDGARYLGPYLSGIALNNAMDAVREHFPVRHCKKDIQRAIARGERPCLYHQLGKCAAPCLGNMSRAQYHEILGQVMAFLEGDVGPVLQALASRMEEAARNLEFERAARLRDSIAAIKSLGDEQQAIGTKDVERDVFALARGEGEALVFAFFVRSGKVMGTEKFFLRDMGEVDGEVMASFLKQYYARAGYVPREVVLNLQPSDMDAIVAWLESLRQRKVRIFLPQRGDRRRQVELAARNAADALQKESELRRRSFERGMGAAAQLAALIGMQEAPRRMECYDNSHIRGRDTVGSMVVFTDGAPDKKQYRRFRIRDEAGGDDCLAMREVLTRRFERAAQGDGKFARLPDLLVVDGGKGQLHAALDVLGAFGLGHIPAIALAERNEEIILPGRDAPLALDRGSPALHLLERIRDEAHRFAVAYHRSLRDKNALYSLLDNISGVGPRRRRALFDAFVSLEAMKTASLAAIEQVPGIDKRTARAVYQYFNAKENKEHGDQTAGP